MSWLDDNFDEVEYTKYQYEQQELVDELLMLYSDNQLRKYIKKCLRKKSNKQKPYADLVNKILAFPGKYTEKQRWCMGKFIVDCEGYHG